MPSCPLALTSEIFIKNKICGCHCQCGQLGFRKKPICAHFTKHCLMYTTCYATSVFCISSSSCHVQHSQSCSHADQHCSNILRIGSTREQRQSRPSNKGARRTYRRRSAHRDCSAHHLETMDESHSLEGEILAACNNRKVCPVNIETEIPNIIRGSRIQTDIWIIIRGSHLGGR